MAGIQSHACTHACAFCNIVTRGKDAYVSGNETLRTLGSLRSNYAKFMADTSANPLKNAKDYDNVVNRPLLSGPDELKLLEIVPIPELHILLGKYCIKFHYGIFMTRITSFMTIFI